MRIIEILPELDIGGVERHVIDLSNELAERGHDVLVISAGGKMQSLLSDKVSHLNLPVHRKNLFIGLFCVYKILKLINKEDWQILHAHSRVPAFIAWWSSSLAKIPWVYTAHACYSLNLGILPLKHAYAAICVSDAVKKHLSAYLPKKNYVVYNGLPKVPNLAKKTCKISDNKIKFLYVGRLTKIKGILFLIETLSALKDCSWHLDVVGDGPLMEDAKTLTKQLSLDPKVTFVGYSPETDLFMLNSSCLLFPSFEEGMGLTLMRAAQLGMPVIASKLEAIEEITLNPETLVEPGNAPGWKDAICSFIKTGTSPTKISLESIPTITATVNENEKIYKELINNE